MYDGIIIINKTRKPCKPEKTDRTDRTAQIGPVFSWFTSEQVDGLHFTVAWPPKRRGEEQERRRKGVLMAEEGKPDAQLFQLLSTLLEQVSYTLSLPCSSSGRRVPSYPWSDRYLCKKMFLLSLRLLPIFLLSEDLNLCPVLLIINSSFRSVYASSWFWGMLGWNFRFSYCDLDRCLCGDEMQIHSITDRN